MRTMTILSAGAALAALASSPAFAQDIYSPPPSSVSAPAPTPAPAAPVTVPSDLPKYVLQMNNRDEHGRPRPMTIEDAISRYGEAGARTLARGDSDRCVNLTKFRDAVQRIRAASEEVRLAEISLAQAQTDLDIKVAKERLKQKRRNLFDVLLSLGQVGLGFLAGKGDLAYAGMVGLNQGQSQLRQRGHNKTTDLWYESMELYGKRLANYDARLDLYDLRVQLDTQITEFWLDSMGNYCNTFYRKVDVQITYTKPAGK